MQFGIQGNVRLFFFGIPSDLGKGFEEQSGLVTYKPGDPFFLDIQKDVSLQTKFNS
jgi:hypothetical protein